MVPVSMAGMKEYDWKVYIRVYAMQDGHMDGQQSASQPDNPVKQINIIFPCTSSFLTSNIHMHTNVRREPLQKVVIQISNSEILDTYVSLSWAAFK